MVFSILRLSRSFSSSSNPNLSHHPSLQTLLKNGFTPTLTDLNSFLVFLYRTRKFEVIVHFLSQMSLTHIKGDPQTHSILTRSLLKLAKFEEAEHLLKTHMKNCTRYPRGRLWDTLIQGVCVEKKDPEKALTILTDCFRNHGIVPSSFTFCSLINMFSCQGQMGKVIEVLELMADEKIKLLYDNFVCSSVISGFCKIGKPELAMQFFDNAVKSQSLQPNVVTYTALVSSFCMLGRVKEVSDLICKMEKEQLVVDVVFYSSWICGYFNQGVLLEALLKHGEMVEKGIKPDTISYTLLIDGFSKEGYVEKAVGFLNKMIKEGLRPNLVTYTTIILGFCKKGKMEEALMIFKMVENMGIELDEFAYATLIHGICKMGDFDHVYRLLEEMEERGIVRSIVTYNIVINGLCKFGRTSEADEFSRGKHGDIITYSTLLHWYTEGGNITGILETKKRLEEAGVGMDVVVCNVLIKAMFIVGSFEDAYRIYRDMPEMDLVADSVTYCTLIDGYCKAGRLDEALEIFDDFRRTSITSVSCYSCIISGLCKKGLISMAVDVFIELGEKDLTLHAGDRMKLIKAAFEAANVEGVLNLVHKIENLEPDIYDVMCNDAILLLCDRGFPEAALKTRMMMRQKGSVVTTKSFYSILERLADDGKMWLLQPLLNTFVKVYALTDGLCRIIMHYLCLKNVDYALRFLNKMRERGSNITFPVTALKALLKNDRVVDAYRLVIKSEGNLPFMDVVDYSTVIDGLSKGGFLIEALDLCAFAKNKGIKLNIISYNTVLNGLCRQGYLFEAFRLFDSLEKIDLVASEITYATLIDTLCREGFLLDAKELFHKMVKKGFEPNTHVYNSFIHVYCRSGQIGEAMKLLYDMEIKCLKPDKFTVSGVVNGFCQKGDMEGAIGIFLEFKQKGILPDFFGFKYLIKGLYAKGRMEEARSVLREMLQSQSVVELINRVDTGTETDSLESILGLLCEQGSIAEAVTVLNEVGSILFPIPRESTVFGGLEKSNQLYSEESLGAVSPHFGTSLNKSGFSFGSYEVDKMEEVTENYAHRDKTSQLQEFESYYSQIGLLCSKRELQKANRVVKEMLSNLNGGGQ